MSKEAIYNKFNLILFFSILVFSCSSVVEEPDWVTNYPSNKAYYIGIGASNTGNRAEDNEIAKKRALSNLAAEISSVIKSDVNFTILSDENGNVKKTAQEMINQIVEQNLKEVETVDSWYSKEYGYWYYLRLNISKWAAIQAKEKKELGSRVVNIIDPVLNSKESSFTDCVTALLDAKTILIDSPYSEAVKGQLAGEDGLFLDIINNKLISLHGTLSIELVNEKIETEAGKPFKLEIQVKSTEIESTGIMKIRLLDKDNNFIESLTTDKNGLFSDFIELSEPKEALNFYAAEIDFDLTNFKNLRLPLINFLVINNKIKTSLLVNTYGSFNNSLNNSSIDASVKSLLLGLFPFSIEKNNNSLDIGFDLHFRNSQAQEYSNSLKFVFVKANISVSKDGRNIFSYVTDEAKGGGLSWAQANEKGLDKLFKDLSKDEKFINSMNLAYK